jgi:hypothetical protein
MENKALVIPGLTEPAPYLIRGNPIFFELDSGFPAYRRQARE